jgi:hypothetical protein
MSDRNPRTQEIPKEERLKAFDTLRPPILEWNKVSPLRYKGQAFSDRTPGRGVRKKDKTTERNERLFSFKVFSD